MLRHTFAVEYLLAGMPIEDVSFLLGHSSVLLTQRVYARWLFRSQKQLVASQRAGMDHDERLVARKNKVRLENNRCAGQRFTPVAHIGVTVNASD
jgi:integrase